MLRALACFIVMVIAGSAAVAQPEPAARAAWVLVAKHQVPASSTNTRVEISKDVGRVRAVRVVVKSGAVALARVVVTYSNGQVHYEDYAQRDIELVAGKQTAPIDQRGEERFVETVLIEFSRPTGAQPSDLEIWALEGPESGEIAKSTDGETLKREDAPTATQPKPRATSRGAGPAPKAKTETEVEKPYVTQPVFFGTDRKRETDRTKNGLALATFSGQGGTSLTLGRAVISIPKKRDRGAISRPEWDLLVASFKLRDEDVSRDFTLLNVDVMQKDAFLGEAKKHMAEARTYKGQAFVFVHGYRVSFDDALFRAAQIAHDMEFDGIPFVYSWPSSAGLIGYVHDKNRASGAREFLSEFLNLVAQETGATRIHLVAHSMGAQPLLEVLREYGIRNAANPQQARPMFNEVILAAPDVTRDNFEKVIQKINGVAEGLTLYASSNDRALSLSRRISLGEVPAGDVPPNGPVVVPGVDTIDVSALSTDFFSLNHNAFADRPQLLVDMAKLLQSGARPPDLRFPIYKVITGTGGTYWKYQK